MQENISHALVSCDFPQKNTYQPSFVVPFCTVTGKLLILEYGPEGKLGMLHTVATTK